MTHLSEYVPRPYRAEGGSIKVVSHGQWRTIATINKELFTASGRDGCAQALAHTCNVHDALVAGIETALTHAQLLGSGQQPLLSNGEMCNLLGEALTKAKGVA